MESSDKIQYLQYLKSGNKIHIKESQKGSFTRYCNGKVTNECIRRGKNSPDPRIRKKATFAANARKWKHQMGGVVYTPFEGKYDTKLTPAEEQSFQDWYKTYSSIHGLNSDPDATEHYYDYRGYWKNGPEPMSLFTNDHLPDTWKKPGHPTFSDESIYANSFSPTIEDLADFTGGFETFSAVPYTLKTSDGKDQVLAGYGSANPEIIKLAKEGKLTKDLAKKEMVRRLQHDYDEWTRLLPEFKNLPEEVKLALVDTSYNGKGVWGTIKNSPNLINLIKSGVTDGKEIASHLTHSKTAGGWLGVRSAARRAMAQGAYDWKWDRMDKYGRQVDHNKYKGPKDYMSSPYYNKYQQGGLVYNPYITQSLLEPTDNESNTDVFNTNNYDTSFPVEPVQIQLPIDWTQSFNRQLQKIEKVRGVTQFKNANINIGNMKDLLDKFEEAGISVRVTSGMENRLTKQGNKSRHSAGDAIDITPINGETYADLRQKIANSPELLEYMRQNKIGIIDETDPLVKAKTGATGDHWHISRGGEAFALFGFKKLFG